VNVKNIYMTALSFFIEMKRAVKTSIHIDQIKLVESVKDNLKQYDELMRDSTNEDLKYYFDTILDNIKDLEHFGRGDRPFFIQDSYVPSVNCIRTKDHLIHIDDYDFKVLRAIVEAIYMIERLGGRTDRLWREIDYQLSRLYAPEVDYQNANLMKELIQHYVGRTFKEAVPVSLVGGSGRGIYVQQVTPANYKQIHRGDAKKVLKTESQNSVDQAYRVFLTTS